jgi:DNA processing protein
MSSSDWRYWIQISQVKGLGEVGFGKLLHHFGSPETLFTAEPEEFVEAGIAPKLSARIQACFDQQSPEVEEELRLIEQQGARLITYFDLDYPVLLKDIHSPPPFIYIKGALEPRDTLAVSIVGSRRATREGRELARQLARGLADHGLTIISGLAIGIDGSAHEGALQAEGGRTIGVLGNGLCQGPPSANRQLSEQFDGQGAVISEFPMNFPASRTTFPKRNRIISGMSLGTIVINAPKRSGALITARFAREQGREVFAAPGRPGDVVNEGCNNLLRDGAHMAASVEDIMDVLADLISRWRTKSDVRAPQPAPPPELPLLASIPKEDKPPPPPPPEPGSLEEKVLALMQTAIHVDEISRQLEIPPSTMATTLLKLEMAGCIQRLPGNRYEACG